MKTFPIFSITLLALCVACVPANTPNELAAIASIRQTQEVNGIATQQAGIPATRDAQNNAYITGLTETAIPPQLTTIAITQQAAYLIATIEADNATRQAAANALVYSQTVASATQYASDVQARIADNNRAIAESQQRANAMQWVYYGGAGVLLFGLLALILIALWQGQQAIVTMRQIHERREWDKATLDAEVNARKFGLYVTSGGFTEMRALAAPIVEQRAANYTRDSQLRAALKNYVTAGVDLARQGVKFPYSRANACKHLLIAHPVTGDWWQLGHTQTVKILREMGVLDNTGAGGETVLVVDVGEYARKIDLSPLPDIPLDPIPTVTITVAGWQATRDVAGMQVGRLTA